MRNVVVAVVSVPKKPEVISLNDMLDKCVSARARRDREKELVDEFDKVRSSYLADLNSLKEKYQPKFDKILDEIDEIRKESLIKGDDLVDISKETKV